ncbi:MAG: hypothetical protein WDZ40_02370 [Candidatus Spechtbacterales bacterium]
MGLENFDNNKDLNKSKDLKNYAKQGIEELEDILKKEAREQEQDIKNKIRDMRLFAEKAIEDATFSDKEKVLESYMRTADDEGENNQVRQEAERITELLEANIEQQREERVKKEANEGIEQIEEMLKANTEEGMEREASEGMKQIKEMLKEEDKKVNKRLKNLEAYAEVLFEVTEGADKGFILENIKRRAESDQDPAVQQEAKKVLEKYNEKINSEN